MTFDFSKPLDNSRLSDILIEVDSTSPAPAVANPAAVGHESTSTLQNFGLWLIDANHDKQCKAALTKVRAVSPTKYRGLEGNG
jgi:hypothetical protein